MELRDGRSAARLGADRNVRDCRLRIGFDQRSGIRGRNFHRGGCLNNLKLAQLDDLPGAGGARMARVIHRELGLNRGPQHGECEERENQAADPEPGNHLRS